jgi:hypothetical protein
VTSNGPVGDPNSGRWASLNVQPPLFLIPRTSLEPRHAAHASIPGRFRYRPCRQDTNTRATCNRNYDLYVWLVWLTSNMGDHHFDWVVDTLIKGYEPLMSRFPFLVDVVVEIGNGDLRRHHETLPIPCAF